MSIGSDARATAIVFAPRTAPFDDARHISISRGSVHSPKRQTLTYFNDAWRFLMKSDTSAGRKWRSRTTVTMVAMLIFVSGILAGHTGIPVVGAADTLQNQDAFKAFEQAWTLIHDNYVLPESIDDEALIQGATKGMVDALGDTGHSTYLTPLEVETTDPGLTGEYVGIGISFDFTGAYPRVAYTLPGGPADKAGVL